MELLVVILKVLLVLEKLLVFLLLVLEEYYDGKKMFVRDLLIPYHAIGRFLINSWRAL